MVEELLVGVDEDTKKELFLYLLDEYEDMILLDTMKHMSEESSVSEEVFFSS